MTARNLTPYSPIFGEPELKQVHRLKAEDLVVGPPILGTPSVGELRVDPATGEVSYVNLAQNKRRTAAARQKKNETILTKKLEALELRVRAAWGKNSKRKTTALGTATAVADGMLQDLCAIDPTAYPPIDPEDPDAKEARDKARQRAIAWIRTSLPKTVAWKELKLKP
jgi:hypothetical protein